MERLGPCQSSRDAAFGAETKPANTRLQEPQARAGCLGGAGGDWGGGVTRPYAPA